MVLSIGLDVGPTQSTEILYSVLADGCGGCHVLRPSKFERHCPMIRHGCRMALMVALNWSVECVK
ncbi:MAG: hypothetical protein BECKG1743F_GA0114225_112353, partial [Candidatus Kentron sp. G]